MSENKELNTGVRVSWEDKKTDSDIQIVGGPTTITKNGTVASIMMLMTDQGPVPAAVIAGDDKGWHIVAPFDRCKIL